MHVSHPLVKEGTIELRDYQENILNTARSKNTLVVLPTGIGKTFIAVMLAAERLQAFPDSKALILAPTKPLAAQHQKVFQNVFNIPEDKIILLTGHIPAEKRKEFYEAARIISATPQTVQNDLRSGTADLSDFSLLIVDECHRSVKKYAYPEVAKAYRGKSLHPRILALTASPSSDESKIREICTSLFIDAVEIRSEKDSDVLTYMKDIDIETVRVDLSNNLKKIQENLKIALKARLQNLKKFHIHIYRKKDLLELQKKIIGKLAKEKKPIYFRLISLATEALKIWHALELLETQSIAALKEYLGKLKETKSGQRLLKDENIKNVIFSLIEIKEEHPKMEKLKEVVAEHSPNKKIIVFSHYRDNIKKIFEEMKSVAGCKPVVLIGQSGETGLSQKEQAEVIRDYESGAYNCLITSPIGEEGLHLASADLAIFYDSVPSEIRTIQRRGRVGRTKVGKIIILLTRRTRDEAYYYTAMRKESKMKTLLKNMQKYGLQKKSLKDFL